MVKSPDSHAANDSAFAQALGAALETAIRARSPLPAVALQVAEADPPSHAVTATDAGQTVLAANANPSADALLNALASGGEQAEQALANATAGLTADQATTFEQALADGLAANQSPEQALQHAGDALSQTPITSTNDVTGLNALATGNESTAGLALGSEGGAALANGSSFEQALTIATQVQTQQASAQAQQMPLSQAGDLVSALTLGDTSAPAMQILLDDPNGAFAQTLLAQLANGADSEAAFAAAMQAAAAQAGQTQAQAVPVSAANQAANALANMDSADALSASAAEGSQSLANALASGMTPDAALSSASQAEQAQAEQISAAGVPVSAADQLANAMAGGDTASLSSAGLTAGGGQELVSTLAAGSPPDAALAAATQADQAQAEQAGAASVPVSAADQIINALAGGGNVAESLGGSALATGGEQSLVDALASGATPGAALAEANQAAQAQTDSAQASTVPISAGDQLANAMASGENVAATLGDAGGTGSGGQVLAESLAEGASPAAALNNANQTVQAQSAQQTASAAPPGAAATGESPATATGTATAADASSAPSAGDAQTGAVQNALNSLPGSDLLNGANQTAGLNAQQSFFLQPVVANANFLATQQGPSGASNNAPTTDLTNQLAVTTIASNSNGSSGGNQGWPQESTIQAIQAGTPQMPPTNLNHAPELGDTLPAQQAADGRKLSFAIPAGAFHDADVGDQLSYQVKMSDGSPLPAWLSFDASTGSFSGLPGNSDVGVYSLSVTATDTSGAGVSQTFSLTITLVNDLPVIVSEILTGKISEPLEPAGDLTSTGTLAFSDIDLTDVHLISVTALDNPLGTLTALLDSDTTGTDTGSTGGITWSYTVAASALESLAAGQTVLESFTLTLDDQQGGIVTRQVDVTLTGSNDIPLITTEILTGNITEPAKPTGNLTSTGTLAFSDVDLTDVHLINVTPTGSPLGILTAVLDSDTTASGAGGSLTWKYVITPSALESLTTEQILVESFTLTLDDQHGGIITRQVDVTLTGSNDRPKITAEVLTGNITEPTDPTGDLTSTGTLTFSDVDLTGEYHVSVTSLDNPLGALTAVLDSNATTGGNITWTYAVAAPTLASLAAGQALVESFTITLKDQQGGALTRQVDITLTGSNDVPLVTSEVLTGSITEAVTPAGDLTGTGTLAFSDVDLTDVHSVSVTPLSTTLGTLTAVLDSDTTTSGSGGNITWNYSVTAAALESLAAGQTQVESYTLTLDDQQGGIVTRQIDVTLTGSNDAPVITSEILTGSLTEPVEPAGDLTSTGTLAFSDVDLTDVHSVSITPLSKTLGTLTAALDSDTTTSGTGGNITWNYNVAAAALESLAAGQTVMESFTLTLDDQQSGIVTRQIDVTLTGSNDVPLTSSEILTGNLTELVEPAGDLTSTGTLAFSDVDLTDVHGVGVTPINAPLGTLTAVLDSDTTSSGTGGNITWNYNVAAAALESLAAGQTQVESYTLTLDDQQGGIVTRQIDVTLTGSNDAPLISSEVLTGSITEPVEPAGDLTSTGTLAFSDVDLTDMHSVDVTPLSTTLGTLMAVLDSDTTTSGTGGNITWNYSVAASTLESLAAGQTQVESFTLTLDDQQGGAITRQVDVTLTGSNDAPQITSEVLTGSITEPVEPAGDLTSTGTLAFSDVDLTDAHTVSVTSISTTLGTLTAALDSDTTGTGTNGNITWNYSVAPAALESLTAGQTVVESFTLTLDDQHGGTITRQVDITITGSDAVPVITSEVLTGSITEPVDSTGNLTSTGTLAFSHVDLTDLNNVSVSVTPSDTSLGTLTAVLDSNTTTDGSITWTYSVTAPRLASLAADQTVVESFTITLDDQHGGTITRQVDVTLTGRNDLPLFTAETLTGSITEPTSPTGNLTSTGTLVFSDVDLTDAHQISVTPTVSNGLAKLDRPLGTLTAVLDSDTTTSGAGGRITWTYSVAAPSLAPLAAGQTIVESFTLTLDDQHGGIITRQVDITLTGSNDIPQITAETLTGSITEAANPAGDSTSTGTLAFSDVDLTDVHTVGVVPVGSPLGTLTAALNSDTTDSGTGGSIAWTYSVADTALESLAKDQTQTESFTLTLDDQHGGIITKQIDITLTGNNDTPLITAEDLVGAVTEQIAPSGNLTDTGTITFTDVDLTDSHLLSATGTPVAATMGSLSAVKNTDTTTTGTGGSLTWTYTIADAALESLAKDQTKTESFTITLDDQHGGIISKQIDITLTGSNDAPIITAEDLVGAVAEQAAPSGNLTDTGTISFTDVDLTDVPLVSATGTPVGATVGNLAAAISTDTTGTGGSLTWTYTVAAGAMEYLAAGQTKVESFTITLDDQHGGIIGKQIDVTLTGSNDAPLLSAADAAGAITELTAPSGNLTDTGIITFTDVDLTDVHLISATGTPIGTTLGSLTAVKNTDTTATGTGGQLTWTYTVAAAALEYLAAGQTKVESFTLTLDDQHGGEISQQIDITITGTNDAATISSNSKSLTEANTAAVLNTSGMLTLTDPDTGEAHSVAQTTAGTYGTFAIDANGAWTYTAGSAHDELTAGQVVTDTFTVASQDGTGTGTVTLTLTGSNDVAAVSSDSKALTEANAAAAISSSGVLTITDPDANEAHSVAQTAAGTYGTFAIDANGAWTYTANGAHDELTAGQVVTDTFTVMSQDGTATGTVTITITGSNDVATVSSESKALTEANTAAALNSSGTLTITDLDANEAHSLAQTAAGTYGAFAVDANGAWTYTANGAHDELTAGQVVTDTFTVSSLDGKGTGTVTITLTGSNDAATVSSQSKALTEGDSSAAISSSGTLTITDLDANEAHSVARTVAGSYGAFVIDSNGAWTYTASSAHDELGAGQVVTDSFTVTSQDGTATGTVTITITGTNDGPSLGTPTAASYSDTTANDTFTSKTGTLSGSDADSAITYGISSGTDNGTTVSRTGTYGTLTVTKTSGAYTFVPNATAINALTANATDSFTVTVSDGSAGASQTYAVNITGVNDAPIVALSGAPAASYTEQAAAVAINSALTLSDIDSTQLTGASVSIATGFTGGDILWFSNQNGITGSYNNASGVLTLTGTTTLANYQTALRSVTFSSISDNPTALSTSRTIDWTVADASTSSTVITSTINVTAVNDAPVVSGNFGNAVAFDGSNGGDWISVPHSADLNVEGSYTIETWFKTNDLTHETDILEKGGWIGSWLLLTLPVGGQAKICIAASGWSFPGNAGNTWQAGTTALLADTWYHVATTWDGTTSKIYLNGVLEASGTPTGDPSANTSPLTIGARSGGINPMTGAVDEVRIWNTVLSQTAIQATMSSTLQGNETGLVGYWKLDENSGTTATDASGHGHTGTFNGGPSWTASLAGSAITGVSLSLLTDTAASDTFASQTGTLSAADADTATLTYGIAGVTPSGGVASLTGGYGALQVNTASGAYTYTPNPTAINGLSTNATDQFTVTASDGAATAYQTLTVNLTGNNDTPTGIPAITGTVQSGQSLAADTSGIADADGLGAFSYQWQLSSNGGTSWSAISGATVGTYTPNSGNVGNLLRVLVSYTDSGGAAESIASAATVAVSAGPNSNPTFTGGHNTGLTILEDAAITTITTAMLQVTDAEQAAAALVYTVDAVPVKGVLSKSGTGLNVSGTFTQADIDADLIHYTPNANANGSDSVSFSVSDGASGTLSGQTFGLTITSVNDALTGAPTISGTATEGQQLTVNTAGIADSDGLGTFSYQWQISADNVNWSAISSATAITYTLSGSDVGKYVRAQVNYTDGGGTAESVASSATAAITALHPGHDLINGLGGIGFGENTHPGNDDTATGAIDITSIFGASGVKFGSTFYTAMYINNNGMVTFGNYFSGFSPNGLSAGVNNGGTYVPAIAAYWTDIYTTTPHPSTTSSGGTSTGSNLVYWDLDTVNKNVIVTWDDVGEYSSGTPPIGAFQIILHDAGSGDMDISLRYEYVVPLASHTVAAGWNTGTAAGTAGIDYYEIPIASGTTSGGYDVLADMDTRTGNTGLVGIWNFSLRSGGVTVAGNTTPTFSGGNNSGLTLSEDAAITTITTAMLQVKDAEQAATALTYTLSGTPGKGTLTNNGATLSNGSTFTQANIDAGLLKYTPTLNANGADNFTVSISDGAGGTLPGQTFTLTITSINDAPVLTAPTALAFTDTAASDTFANQTGTLSATDIDTGTTLTYGVSGGASSLNTINGVAYNRSLAGSYGTLYLASIGGAYVYVPNPVAINALSSNTTDAFTMTVSDGINTPTQTLTVNLTGANDAPTATNLSAAEAFSEDASAFSLTDIVITDTDLATVTATLTLSNAAAGSISTATSGAVTSTFASGVWTAGGAIADVNTLLAGAGFTPAANYDQSFNIAASVTDGVAAAITGSKTITVTAVNDAPSFTGNASLASIAENTTNSSGDTVTNLLGARFSDVDGNALAGIAISADTSVSGTDGNWEYSTNSGANWFDVGSVSTNSALLLDAGSKLRFVPATNFSGTPGALTVHAVDNSSSTTFTSGSSRATFNTTTDGATSLVSASGASLTISINQIFNFTDGLIQHYYEYVSAPSGISWTDAKTAAALRSYNGMPGYLVTITSQAESDYIHTSLPNSDAWIGASDHYTEINAATSATTYANQSTADGNWYWVTGPERGTKFSSGNVSPTTITYANWTGGEPNGTNGGEDYGQIYTSGTWNDISNTNSRNAYLVEYSSNCLSGDPIVLDLDHNGADLLPQQAGTQFDINADGTPDTTGWVGPTDGLLALDRNGNHLIDDAGELFSEYSTPGVTNGVDALREFDLNHDARIDGADAVTADLRIWQDLNSDGVSGADELLTLPQTGISSIDLNMDAMLDTQNGNTLLGSGKIDYADGSQGRWYDVGFGFEAGVGNGTQSDGNDPTSTGALTPPPLPEGERSEGLGLLAPATTTATEAQDAAADLAQVEPLTKPQASNGLTEPTLTQAPPAIDTGAAYQSMVLGTDPAASGYSLTDSTYPSSVDAGFHLPTDSGLDGLQTNPLDHMATSMLAG